MCFDMIIFVQPVGVVCCLCFKKFQCSPLLQKSRLPATINSSSNGHTGVSDCPSAQKVARYLLALVHERISVQTAQWFIL